MTRAYKKTHIQGYDVVDGTIKQRVIVGVENWFFNVGAQSYWEVETINIENGWAYVSLSHGNKHLIISHH